VEVCVIWEIEIAADSPKEATLEARVVQLPPGMSATVFDFWGHGAGRMHRTDLVEESNRLDRDELFAAGLFYDCCSASRTRPRVSKMSRP
jgi:hypothetical protein